MRIRRFKGHGSTSGELLLLSSAIFLILVALHVAASPPIVAYVIAFIAASAVYWLLAQRALTADSSQRLLVVVLLLLLAIRATFLMKEPIGSDDFYRYVWDGRVQTAGINPYEFAPADEALRSLRSDSLPSLVNHPNMKTIYFPLSQWLFFISYQISGEQIWGIKLLILLAEILTTVGLLFLLREEQVFQWRILLYAANPLIILQFSLDAHVDALGFPFLIFALLSYRKRKTLLVFFLLGLSMLIKPVAFVLLPILFLSERGIINRVKSVIVPLFVMLIPFVPYIEDANPFESLLTFSKHWAFNGALFSVVFPLVSDNQTARIVCLNTLAIVLLPLYFSKKSFNEKVVLAVLFMLLCSPVAHPWYIGWLIVLLPLAPIQSGLALAATASFSTVTFITHQLQGIWKEYPLALALEYLPVIGLLLHDLTHKHSAPE